MKKICVRPREANIAHMFTGTVYHGMATIFWTRGSTDTGF